MEEVSKEDTIIAMTSTTRRVAKANRTLEARENPNIKGATGTCSWPRTHQTEESCALPTTRRGCKGQLMRPRARLPRTWMLRRPFSPGT